MSVPEEEIVDVGVAGQVPLCKEADAVFVRSFKESLYRLVLLAALLSPV